MNSILLPRELLLSLVDDKDKKSQTIKDLEAENETLRKQNKKYESTEKMQYLVIADIAVAICKENRILNEENCKKLSSLTEENQKLKDQIAKLDKSALRKARNIKRRTKFSDG